ncbi:MAG TPA: type II secretion system F family protein [Gammaproteobacteria bacterium]|nr:type II secretion system F family protein [Gammaproteobacteria bacterium]
MESTPAFFLIMVFVSAFLLVYSFVVPVFGAERQAAKRLKKRLRELALNESRQSAAGMLREKYLRELSPLERWLEALPGMERLALFAEQSGHLIPAYRIILVAVVLGVGAGWLTFILLHQPVLAMLAAVAGFLLPFFRISIQRSKRINRFEEQLPDALDVMVRALKAGHPFSGTLQLVSEEMDDPIAKEFGITFADINYGLDVKQAFMNLLERMPNMTLMTLVTAVVVQRETGGNLAETLSKISAVIRGRFRFNRRVKTLSAEGRMSAWILAMIPFLLFIVIMLTTPSYMPILMQEPAGRKIIAVSFTLQVIGILWLRRVIRIEV